MPNVIVLTGVPNPKEEKEVLAMGARLYCVKPPDFEGFKGLAREIVNICSGLTNAATG